MDGDELYFASADEKLYACGRRNEEGAGEGDGDGQDETSWEAVVASEGSELLRLSEDESKSLLRSVKVRESERPSESVDASLSASEASEVYGEVDVFPA